MKKILIWDMFPLSNTGGPSGYLYNIKEYLCNNSSDQISFLSDLLKSDGRSLPWDKQQIRKTPNCRIEQILYQLEKVYRLCLRPFWKIEYRELSNIEIDKFDYVHVHIITHVSQFRKLFPSYKGKLILTIHCPCTWTEEILSYTASNKSKLNNLTRKIRPLILKEECKAYKSADYIMFPCAGAKEPYFKEPRVKLVFEEIKDKFFYVPSAILDYCVNNDCFQRFSELGIPQNAFVITFFGRHNEVKGYDVLIEAGLRLLDTYDNLYILCAGKGNIDPPSHPRWIELGFINNVDDLLSQASLYILPNKETYFDLITLQVLRAGVPLLLSTTGGNKYFQELPKNEIDGLIYFPSEDIDDIVRKACDIIELHENNNDGYQMMRKDNRTLFERYFTLKKYLSMYVDNINSLLE